VTRPFYDDTDAVRFIQAVLVGEHSDDVTRDMAYNVLRRLPEDQRHQAALVVHELAEAMLDILNEDLLDQCRPLPGI
jgi:hypothetical protein